MKNIIILTAFIFSLNTISAQTNNDDSTINRNFRVSLEAGYGYRTGALAKDLQGEGEAHLKRLLSGRYRIAPKTLTN